MSRPRRGHSPLALALALIAIALLAAPAGGILVDPVTVEGTVHAPGGEPLGDVHVVVVGLEEHNATSDAEGCYTLVVPYIQVGHTLTFQHQGYSRLEQNTGPLEPNGLIVLDVTLEDRPDWAVLHVRLLPWDISDSNYGLRQERITVVNATGTPAFYYEERSTEEEVTVQAPGTYLVTGSAPGYYDHTVEVTVFRGERLDVDVDMSDHKRPSYGTVTGSIEHGGEPVPGAVVVAEREDGDRTWQAVSNGSGGFALDLPPGNYWVNVTHEGYSKTTRWLEVTAGATHPVDFAMSIARSSGEEGTPLFVWASLGAALVILGAVAILAVRHSRRAAAAEAAAKAELDTLSCPECGVEASPDADECPYCGARFPWRSFRCPDCGALMGLEERRCPECGNETFDLHRG